MQLGAHHSVWRQRVIGSTLAVPGSLALCLGGLLPLHGAQLGIFAALLVANLAALRARDGRSLAAWPLYACEGLALALFVRETGGAASPFQAFAYPWVLGVALTLLLDGSRTFIVPLFTALAAVSLFIGGWGTDGFVRFVVVHSAALASTAAAALSLNAERRVSRADPLLPMVLNRGAGLERLGSWVRAGRAFHLTFIDLGDFKGINDRYGHRVGDEVLRAVAARLRGAVRAGDVVLRYGGDEFVVATRNAAGARLEALFGTPVGTSAGPLGVTADIGHVPYRPGDDLEGLLHLADTLMYGKKRARQAHRAVPPGGPRAEPTPQLAH